MLLAVLVLIAGHTVVARVQRLSLVAAAVAATCRRFGTLDFLDNVQVNARVVVGAMAATACAPTAAAAAAAHGIVARRARVRIVHGARGGRRGVRRQLVARKIRKVYFRTIAIEANSGGCSCRGSC